MFRGLLHVHTKKQIPGPPCTWRTLSLKDLTKYPFVSKHPRVGGEFSYITGAICDFAVWSHRQPRRHQPGQETPQHKKAGRSKTFHRRKQPLYTTSSGQSIKLVIAGHKRRLQALIFHALVNGAGKERSHAAGKPTGPHCQKQRWPAENFWGVVAREVAKRIANAQRLLCSAQLYVNAVDNAL